MNMNDFDNRWKRHHEIMNRHKTDMEKFQKFFFIMWLFASVLGIGIVGVGIWAVIRLVMKFS